MRYLFHAATRCYRPPQDDKKTALYLSHLVYHPSGAEHHAISYASKQGGWATLSSI